MITGPLPNGLPSTIANVKRYICDTCINMTRKELVDILNFLHREHVDERLFSQNLDGIKIDLNSVPENIIETLYNYIQYKLNKPVIA
jgi:hypothetical protein